MRVKVLNFVVFEAGVFGEGVELLGRGVVDGGAVDLAGGGDGVDAVGGTHGE